MRAASLASGLSAEAVSKMLRTPEHSQTLESIDKLAKGLQTTGPWLAYGITMDDETGRPLPSKDMMVVNMDLLKQAVLFVLRNEGVPERRAHLIADILPEALQGPPIEAVERDPFQSFRVHLQLEERKSDHPK